MGAGSRGGNHGIKASGRRPRLDKEVKKAKSAGGSGGPARPSINGVRDLRRLDRVAKELKKLLKDASKSSGSSSAYTKSAYKAALKTPTTVAKATAIKKPPKIKGNKIKILKAKNIKLQ